MKKNINGGRDIKKTIIPKEELFDIVQKMGKIDPKIISHNFYEVAKERKKTNKFFKGRGKKDKSESSIDEFSDELNKNEKKISESSTEKKKDYKCGAVKNKCAPGVEYDAKNKTCFSMESLLKLADKFNLKHPNDKIDIKQDKKYLLKQLIKKINKYYNCKGEKCWPLINELVSDDDVVIKYFTLKTEGPIDNTWLDTITINSFFLKYEVMYLDFVYLKTRPNDFYSGNNQPKEWQINLDTIEEEKNKDKNRFGIVINHDNNGQSGSHWVALYFDLKKRKIFYFDSVGEKPKKEVKKFIDDLIDKYKLEYKYNKKGIQKGNSECGVYSITFILRMLKGQTFEEIISDNLSDKDIRENCRKRLFGGINKP